jgi:membrane-associated phospholipid phosphatase
LLALSTLFTKQHYIFDFITGLAVGLLAWNYLLKPSLHWAATIEAIEYTAKWDE